MGDKIFYCFIGWCIYCIGYRLGKAEESNRWHRMSAKVERTGKEQKDTEWIPEEI